MPRNRLQRIVPERLATIAKSVAKGIGPDAPNPFCVGQAEIDALAGAILDHGQAALALGDARAAYHAAVAVHERARTALATATSNVANVCYAAPTVTSAMIVGLGLSPRSPGRAPVRPKAARGLVAKVQPGGVVLSFDRGENPEGVSFVLEIQEGAKPWAFHSVTRRTRLHLNDLGPIRERSFRVTTTANGQTAPPSNVAVVFPGVAA